MLDDRHGRRLCRVELGDKLVGGVGVVDVVVGERLALHLPGSGDTGAAVAGKVERCRLVRVLAVAERRAEASGEAPPRRRALVEGCGEPAGDGGVIGGGPRERLPRQLLAKGVGQGAVVCVERVDDRRVILRRHADRHIGVVLGTGADHRRSADVDVLDRRGVVGARRDGFLERIEIDDEEVDPGDPVFRHRRRMGGIVAHPEKPAMHVRMERLHPAVHDLRKTGDLGELGTGDAGPLERRAGAAGRYDLGAARRERTGEIDHAGLVVDRDEGAPDHDTIGRRDFRRGNSHRDTGNCERAGKAGG